MTDKDFNIKVTIRNAHILRLMRKRFKSMLDMCKQTGISYNQTCALVTMRQRPFTKNGELSKAAEELCSALGATPSELWPKDMAKIQARRSTHEIELTQAEAMAIAGGGEERVIHRQLIAKWAKSLSDRQITAISLSQSGMTLDEIGEELGVSHERARQILAKGFRTMRTAANRDGVTAFAEVME